MTGLVSSHSMRWLPLVSVGDLDPTQATSLVVSFLTHPTSLLDVRNLRFLSIIPIFVMFTPCFSLCLFTNPVFNHCISFFLSFTMYISNSICYLFSYLSLANCISVYSSSLVFIYCLPLSLFTLLFSWRLSLSPFLPDSSLSPF